MHNKQLITMLALAPMLWSCSSDEPGKNEGTKDEVKNNPRKEIVLSRGQQEIVASQNDFAFKLFGVAAKQGNNVISPMSVSMAVSMTGNGAAGETYEEICSALGLPGASLEEVNTLNRLMLDRLPVADKTTTLSIANSLWSQTGFNILDGFIGNMAKYYDAETTSLDLADKMSIARINSWVADKTDGHIPMILDQPIEATAMMVNTLYFKSVWSTPFSKKNTKKETFNNQDGTKAKVEMMHSDPAHLGLTDEGATVVRLAYGNRTFTFTAILPPEGMTTAEYANSLSADKMVEWNNGFKEVDYIAARPVKVGMPRFTDSSDFDLIPILKELGIKKAFTPIAEFTNLSTVPGFHLTKAAHKATIEVDEEGVVATASTIVAGGFTSVCPVKADEVVFDRPFIYIISESSTGTILFIGDVNKFN